MICQTSSSEYSELICTTRMQLHKTSQSQNITRKNVMLIMLQLHILHLILQIFKLGAYFQTKMTFGLEPEIILASELIT